MQHHEASLGTDDQISVIMLAHDREKWIPRAVESVLSQTYNNFELIIIDNGSSDASSKFAEDYAKRDSRVKVIRREDSNIGAGRNTGLDAAKGSYITFVDDDDAIEPDYLEFLLNLTICSYADISVCGSDLKQFDDKLILDKRRALYELMLRRLYTAGFPAKLFKRSLFKNMRFNENGRTDDIFLIYKIFAEANRVAFDGAPKYRIFRHNSNNSAWTADHSMITNEILDEYISAYRERTVWLTDRFPEDEALFKYFEWSFMISMVEKINRFNLTACQDHLKAMTRELSRNKQEFLNSPEITDFEKEWTEKYITN